MHLYEEHNGIFYANVQPFEAYIMVTDSCILEKLKKNHENLSKEMSVKKSLKLDKSFFFLIDSISWNFMEFFTWSLSTGRFFIVVPYFKVTQIKRCH